MRPKCRNTPCEFLYDNEDDLTHEPVEHSDDDQSEVVGEDGPAQVRQEVETDEGGDAPDHHQHRHNRETYNHYTIINDSWSWVAGTTLVRLPSVRVIASLNPSQVPPLLMHMEK